MLAGEGAQASGEDGPCGPPVEPLGREDRLAAAGAGALETGERPPDPAELGQGETMGLVEGDAPGDGDPDPPRGPDGQGNVPGPPALFEEDGPDAVERDGAARRRDRSAQPRPQTGVSLRNRTASGPTCC